MQIPIPIFSFLVDLTGVMAFYYNSDPVILGHPVDIYLDGPLDLRPDRLLGAHRPLRDRLRQRVLARVAALVLHLHHYHYYHVKVKIQWIFT